MVVSHEIRLTRVAVTIDAPKGRCSTVHPPLHRSLECVYVTSYIVLSRLGSRFGRPHP